MRFCFVTLQILIFCTAVVSRAQENGSLPPYSWPNSPKFSLNLDYQPIKGWRIETIPPGKGAVYLRESGRIAQANGAKSRDNTTYKGKDESLYLLHFDYADYLKHGGAPIREKEIDPARPIFLGWDYHDFSTRFRRKTGERGFSRKFIIAAEFSGMNSIPLDVPSFGVNPRSPDADWQRFLLPLVTAEGCGDYMVINGFDKAGMTVGFSQMAAHTPNDLIAMLRQILQSEALKKDPYANPQRWFPELGITGDGKLGCRKGASVISLEECTKYRNKNEGFLKPPGWCYYREDFVRFCNPSVKEINRAELQFAARWLMWSMSATMRHAQLDPVRNNVVGTLLTLENPPARVSGADAAIAAVILHWRNGEVYRKIVSRLLREPSPLATFLALETRPGEPGAKMIDGGLLSKETSWFRATASDRKIINQRIVAVRTLFESDPALLERLRALKFDFRTGTLTR